MITLPHAIFIYDETGNPVPVVSGSLLTSGSRGFVVYGKDGNNEARNFLVDASGNLNIVGTVSVNNFPATQDVTGTVAVSNHPTSIIVTQATASNLNATITGTVAVQNIDVALSTRLADSTFISRINTLGQKAMSGSTPVVLPSDQTILVNLKQSNDSFSQPVVAGRYNQIEIAYDQTDPDAVTDITVTKTNGGDAINSAGQAVFSSGINTNGGVKAVTNTSVAYRPHSEIYAAFTAIFTTGIANSYQRIGIYDANNGFFVGYEGTNFGVTIRKGGVDVTTSRASFNIDTLLGSVTSKYTRNGVPESLDTTKDNLYRIRFGWLGAAPIFFEVLSPDGEWVTFHIIKHPNTTAGTSINNPDLPITLDIQKTGAGATNLTVSTACWAAGTTSDLAKVSSTVTDNSLVKFVRSVLTAKKPNGDYTNIQATAGGNLKVSVEEFDPAVFGQETMANSLPVVIASNQTVIPVSDNSGSLTIDNTFIDANLSTLATTANQTNGNQKTQIVDGVNILDINASGQAAIQNQPNMDVALSTRLSEAQFTSSIGEVSSTPTANTVLGRLKDVEDELIARLGTIGQKTMSGSTPVVIASDQSRVLVETTIADEAGNLADIVKNGTRTALAIEYPSLLWEVKSITRELKMIRKHLEVITDEDFEEDF